MENKYISDRENCGAKEDYNWVITLRHNKQTLSKWSHRVYGSSSWQWYPGENHFKNLNQNNKTAYIKNTFVGCVTRAICRRIKVQQRNNFQSATSTTLVNIQVLKKQREIQTDNTKKVSTTSNSIFAPESITHEENMYKNLAILSYPTRPKSLFMKSSWKPGSYTDWAAHQVTPLNLPEQRACPFTEP